MKKVVGLQKDHHYDNRYIIGRAGGIVERNESTTARVEQMVQLLGIASEIVWSVKQSVEELKINSLNSLFVARLVATIGESFITNQSSQEILVVNEAS